MGARRSHLHRSSASAVPAPHSPGAPRPPRGGASSDRLLPWIAAERTLRAVLLVGVGIVLLTHTHTDWAAEVTSLVRKLGLDPKQNWVQRILKDVAKISSSKAALFGAAALAYGALEGVEAYGLWRRRRWGEWLTLLATSLLLIPEVWELTKSTTALKLGALVVNLVIVAYLAARLRAHAAAPDGA